MSAESLTGSTVGDQIVAGLTLLVVGTICAYIYKNRSKLRRKDFSITVIKKKKPDSQKSFNDKFGNSKPDVSPSVRENMRSIRRMLSVFDLRSPIYNERLFCGCKAKDKIIVELCQSDRRNYIGGMYVPPEGYYISDDIIF